MNDAYSASEVAARLGVSVSQVYRYIRTGLLEAYRFGEKGQWRVKPETLDEFTKNWSNQENDNNLSQKGQDE